MRRLSRAAMGAAVPLALLTTYSLVASQPGPSLPAPSPGLILPGAEAPLPETLNQANPQVQSDGAGHVYRLWVDEWAGRDRHIRFQRSADGGKTWLADALKLDRDKPANATSSSPSFAHDAAGHVMVVWRTRFQDGGGRKELRFLGSADAGATWPDPPQVLSRGGGALAGEVNTDGQGHVYVAWSDERSFAGASAPSGQKEIRVFFNRSEDFGKSWLPEDVQLTGLVPGTEASPGPGVEEEKSDRSGKARGGRQPGGRRRAGRERGAPRERIARPIAGYAFLPHLQSDRQGRVGLAWVDTRGGDAEIYVRVSEDHGKSWGPEANVSQGARSATGHQLLTDGQGRFFLVWSDRRHGLEADDVFFSRSEDGGKQWEPPTRLSRRPAGATSSVEPSIAWGSDGRLYVAWADRRSGREDVYFTMSMDGGKTWLDHDVRLDRDAAGTGISRNPFVVTRGPGEVAVLWDDDRTGFNQILLNRSSDGGRTWLAQEVVVGAPTLPKQRAQKPRAAWDPSGALHVVWDVATGEGNQIERRVAYRQLLLVP